MDTLFIPLSLAAGALLAVQAGANAQLAKATCSPFAATTLQLAVGALLLFVFTALSGTISALSLLPSAQWWHAIGGVASAFYVVAGILLFPRIGAVVSVGLFIAGQVLASAALDVFGLLGLPATGLGFGVSIGAAMVMSGASLIVLGQKGARSEVAQLQLGWIALGLLAGAVLPVQGAVNALLRHDLGGATFLVGTISFVVATLAMAATLIGTTALPGAAKTEPSWRAGDAVVGLAWWLCRGDLCDHGLYGDTRDWRCFDSWPDGCWPAGRLGLCRQVRMVPTAAAPCHGDPAGRHCAASRRCCCDQADLVELESQPTNGLFAAKHVFVSAASSGARCGKKSRSSPTAECKGWPDNGPAREKTTSCHGPLECRRPHALCGGAALVPGCALVDQLRM